jgi:glyoxylase-like metal-dependent hydrolase (beta-lactamase superfamily II)
MSGYTGNVHVGGPAQVRELTDLVLSKVAVGPMDNNVYLLRCRRTGAQVLIDAAADAPALIDLAGPGGLQVIATTHRHPDHVGALAEVRSATGARTVAHPLDAPHLPVAADQVLEDGETLQVGSITLTAIHLAGHTPGGLALYYDDPEGHGHLFSGDSLFPGGVGRTLSAEDFNQLIGDVETKLFSLPDETWVYPGHGADTTIGTERPSLNDWRARGW